MEEEGNMVHTPYVTKEPQRGLKQHPVNKHITIYAGKRINITLLEPCVLYIGRA